MRSCAPIRRLGIGARRILICRKMVISVEREKLRQVMTEREAEKQRSRASKEAVRAERELKRRQEVAEKEQKRKERKALEEERELKKRKKEARKQLEEFKKQQVEAEKDQRRREREAAETDRETKRRERELKRQHDEAEKEHKRKEKEATERKKQLLLQKQANIMDRLFRRKETDALSPQGKHCSADQGSLPCSDQHSLHSHSTCRPELSTADVILRLDEKLTSTCLKTEDELLRSHIAVWQKKWKCRSSDPFRRWGVRMTPKVRVFSELRLQGAGMESSRKTDSTANGGSFSSSDAQAPSLKRRRLEDGSLDDCDLDNNVRVPDDDADAISSPTRKKQCNLRWKLLQFDKSHRPAYYGTFSKSSSVVGPRHPLKRDPLLDYEVDSDEEWEEEDPGESLSDCEDKEDELEKVESELDEDAADDFVVPDGYLSENEGVHLEEADVEDSCEATQSPSPGESCTIFECPGSMDQMVRKHQHLMKLLDNVTKHALQRNRPFLVSDLLQQAGEKCRNMENLSDRLCFQALRVCIVAPNILIGPSAIELEG